MDAIQQKENIPNTFHILHIYSSPVRVRVPIVRIYKVKKFLSCLWCTYYDSESLIKGEKFYWMKALKSFSWQYTFCWCLILEIFRIFSSKSFLETQTKTLIIHALFYSLTSPRQYTAASKWEMYKCEETHSDWGQCRAHWHFLDDIFQYEWSTLYPLVLIIIYCMTRLLLLVLLCCYRKEMEKHLHIYCLTWNSR